jgi:hypothetical protein
LAVSRCMRASAPNTYSKTFPSHGHHPTVIDNRACKVAYRTYVVHAWLYDARDKHLYELELSLIVMLRYSIYGYWYSICSELQIKQRYFGIMILYVRA